MLTKFVLVHGLVEFGLQERERERIKQYPGFITIRYRRSSSTSLTI